jgi:glutathione S-transferase
MSRAVKLYTFNGSNPSLTVELMLAHKGIEYRRADVLVGPHAFAMLARGFDTMTVPALKIEGRRVQGSRVISRALDELQPEPGLFPADAMRRQAVIDAERWGEDFQDAARRIVLYATRLQPTVFGSIYGHATASWRPVQRVARRVVIRLASAGHNATHFTAQEHLAELPARLEQIDAWINEGLLNGSELNAADFQIAPSIALLLRFEELAPLIDQRPAAHLARRLVPNVETRIGAVLAPAGLAPHDVTVFTAPRDGPTGPK